MTIRDPQKKDLIAQGSRESTRQSLQRKSEGADRQKVGFVLLTFNSATTPASPEQRANYI